MPLEIEHEGKKITVYTREELDGAVSAAKTGLLSEEDAKRLADSAAAKARREAEGKLTELQAELAKAGKSAEQIAALEKQIAEQAGKIACSERTLKGIKALSAAGLTPAAAEQLLALPALAEADFDTPEGQAKAAETLKSTFPALFASGDTSGGKQAANLQPAGGVGASPAKTEGKPASLSEAVLAHYTKK